MQRQICITYHPFKPYRVIGDASLMQQIAIRDVLPDWLLEIINNQESQRLVQLSDVSLEVKRYGIANQDITILICEHLIPSNQLEFQVNQQLHAISEINHQFSLCKNSSSLFKLAVNFCIQELHVDRSAIFTIDMQQLQMQGTWGTDNQGKIYCDNNFSIALDHSDWLLDMIENKQSLAFHENIELETSGSKERQGWQFAAIMYIDGEAKAWLSCDNLIKQRPLLPAQKEVITVFCASLCQWFQSIIDRQQLKIFSNNLQQLVEKRTKKLQDSLIILGQTQGKLTAYEKLCMISKFSSGLAHEINNPNSFVLSNLDFLKNQTTLIEQLTNKDLSPEQSRLLEQLKHFWPELVEDSLNGANRIKNIIKALSPLNHCLDINTLDFDLCDCILHCSRRFAQRLVINTDTMPAQCYINSKKNVIFHCIEQILFNSAEAYDHESRNNESINKKVNICLFKLEDCLHINITDFAQQISTEVFQKMFEPFYTSKLSNVDNVGLGLAITQQMLSSIDGRITAACLSPGLSIDIFIDSPTYR